MLGLFSHILSDEEIVTIPLTETDLPNLNHALEEEVLVLRPSQMIQLI
jgi:hypothetical protein